MTLTDFLPWLNLLMLPALSLLVKISGQLATLEADYRALNARVTKIDGIKQ